jgi:hypothetical protein
MVTEPANDLIRTLTTDHAESDRMPRLLSKNGSASWLGENDASQEAKAWVN